MELDEAGYGLLVDLVDSEPLRPSQCPNFAAWRTFSATVAADIPSQ